MKITGENSFLKLESYVKNVKDTGKSDASHADKSGAPLGEDSVDLSPKAREVKEAERILASIPDIRESEVAEIKRQIEEGTYEIDADETARSMVKESLLNELL
jgi:negative regulator of flagellin synthesis FlgM